MHSPSVGPIYRSHAPDPAPDALSRLERLTDSAVLAARERVLLRPGSSQCVCAALRWQRACRSTVWLCPSAGGPPAALGGGGDRRRTPRRRRQAQATLTALRAEARTHAHPPAHSNPTFPSSALCDLRTHFSRKLCFAPFPLSFRAPAALAAPPASAREPRGSVKCEQARSRGPGSAAASSRSSFGAELHLRRSFLSFRARRSTRARAWRPIAPVRRRAGAARLTTPASPQRARPPGRRRPPTAARRRNTAARPMAR